MNWQKVTCGLGEGFFKTDALINVFPVVHTEHKDHAFESRTALTSLSPGTVMASMALYAEVFSLNDRPGKCDVHMNLHTHEDMMTEMETRNRLK